MMQGKRLEGAPVWVEHTAPRTHAKREVPSLLLINMPDEDCYVVATIEETDAIANPDSFVGRLLRPHCALLSLAYMSNN